MPEPLLPPIHPYTKQQLPTERVTIPMVFPVVNATRWRPSYNEDWGSHRHTGCDLIAPKLSPVIAPFAGVLGFKPQTFWIVRDDGWGCLGTHLNDDTPGTNDNKANLDFMFAPNLVPGERVHTGQLIGYVGDSGDADGPHLHFELHGPEGMRDPAPSLKEASRIRSPILQSPPDPNRIEGCIRRFDAKTRQLTILPLTEPRYKHLVLSEAALAQLGGSTGIATMERTRVVILCLQNSQSKWVERAFRGPVNTLPPQDTGQPLLRLSGSGLSSDPILTRCATAELAQFTKLSSPRWIRTGSMALGPLRMRGTKLKQAAILGLSGAPASLFSQEIVQEALRYSGFTRFGGALGNGRMILILADG
jgi:murein DD-endopeptidase MepM/ murein hydrolase activator NlpD